MKKILVLFSAVMLCVVSCFAQTNLVSQYSLPLDTVSNTGTKYLSLASPINSYFKTAHVAVTYTKISGTIAGSVTLEYSIDGTNFYSLKRDSVYVPTDVATQTFGWAIPDFGARYIRVKSTGAGTMSAQVKAKIHARKENS